MMRKLCEKEREGFSLFALLDVWCPEDINGKVKKN